MSVRPENLLCQGVTAILVVLQFNWGSQAAPSPPKEIRNSPRKDCDDDDDCDKHTHLITPYAATALRLPKRPAISSMLQTCFARPASITGVTRSVL